MIDSLDSCGNYHSNQCSLGMEGRENVSLKGKDILHIGNQSKPNIFEGVEVERV